jgi:hypothetical protein
MKTIIAGSRTINSYDLVVRAIHESGWTDEITEVLCGMASGVDLSGKAWADAHGIEVKQFFANWRAHGRSAGPRRNEMMVRYADALILVWDGKSPGSSDVLRKAKVQGLRIYEHIVQS